MGNLIDKAWDKPWQFVLICAGVALLLKVSAPYAPQLFRFLIALVKILIGEFLPHTKKDAIAKINRLLIVIFGLIVLLAEIYTLLPSAIDQAVGATNQVARTDSLTASSRFHLLIVAIASPVFILLDRHERSIKQLLQKLLK